MRLLLDTHAVLWWFNGNERLSPHAREVLEGGHAEVFVSAVSAMEVTTKHRIGKLPEAQILSDRFVNMVAQVGFAQLPVTLAHGALAGRLAVAHKDPFDRLLIAQAMIENLTLVSNEKVFDQTGVSRLW